MELEVQLDALMDKIKKHREVMATEEAAKLALVMPFLQALGYDVTNPSEVIPEYTSDTPGKKGEKVDFAICIDGNVSMLVECKSIDQDLTLKHASQLYRYFSFTEAKFAILTNGSVYKFYSDLDATNKMDDRPFFEFDLSKLKKSDYRHISKFHRSGFDVASIVEAAENLQMEMIVTKALQNEMVSPSDELVRLIASKVTDRRLTAGVKAAISRHIPNAFNAIMRERLNDRLSSAIDEGHNQEPASASEYETTADEIEGFQIVRAIASDIVDPSRICIRDSKSYCAVLLDDNNRKTVARLWFNSDTVRYLGTFGAGKDETRQPITEVAEIYKYNALITERIKALLSQ